MVNSGDSQNNFYVFMDYADAWLFPKIRCSRSERKADVRCVLVAV